MHLEVWLLSHSISQFQLRFYRNLKKIIKKEDLKRKIIITYFRPKKIIRKIKVRLSWKNIKTTMFLIKSSQILKLKVGGSIKLSMLMMLDYVKIWNRRRILIPQLLIFKISLDLKLKKDLVDIKIQKVWRSNNLLFSFVTAFHLLGIVCLKIWMKSKIISKIWITDSHSLKDKLRHLSETIFYQAIKNQPQVLSYTMI